MKSIKLCAAPLLILFLALSLSNVQAQDNEESDIILGGGLSYGEKMSDLGIQLGGYYIYDETFRFGGDFIYWLRDSHSNVSYTNLEINANVHYLFYEENDITLYGIGTLGIHYMSFDYDFAESVSDTELGLGIGAGIEYDIGAVLLYGEPRLFLTGFDQFALNFGVRFGI